MPAGTTMLSSAWASAIACRSEPGPLSFVLETVIAAAAALAWTAAAAAHRSAAANPVATRGRFAQNIRRSLDTGCCAVTGHPSMCAPPLVDAIVGWGSRSYEPLSGGHRLSPVLMAR